MRIDEEIKIKDHCIRFTCGLFYVGFAILKLDLKKMRTDIPFSFFIGFHWFVNRFHAWGLTFQLALLKKGIKDLEPIGGIHKEIVLYQKPLK